MVALLVAAPDFAGSANYIPYSPLPIKQDSPHLDFPKESVVQLSSMQRHCERGVVQYSAVQYSAMQCSALQCIVNCSTCSAAQLSAI